MEDNVAPISPVPDAEFISGKIFDGETVDIGGKDFRLVMFRNCTIVWDGQKHYNMTDVSFVGQNALKLSDGRMVGLIHLLRSMGMLHPTFVQQFIDKPQG